ncbi:Bax inhibitor-1/YccA family protein [Kiloniella litopenaei]|uniref:Bax inhibitor-1/YccA family protein n=1 Tax=Kiloniella litopenaei TaxID=1549748 RepID=UPI003BACD24D
MIDRSTQRSVGYGQATAADIDAGLRKYMLGVYNYMFIAMLITGLVAFGASLSEPLMATIYNTPLKFVVIFAPLGVVIYLGAKIHSMSAATAQIVFWIYAALVGLSLSFIFIAYTKYSIISTFFVTAIAFASLSLIGYTTKKNLSGLGSFCYMGVIGIALAIIVNIFLQSPGMQFVISGVGVLAFAGLTAYDTQNIKLMYLESDGHEVSQKKSLLGALRLYLDFLNMFSFLLYFLGERE